MWVGIGWMLWICDLPSKYLPRHFNPALSFINFSDCIAIDISPPAYHESIYLVFSCFVADKIYFSSVAAAGMLSSSRLGASRMVPVSPTVLRTARVRKTPRGASGVIR